MTWIDTIAPEAATGRLAEAYEWQAKSLGRPTEFTRLGSFEPELVHARLALYKATEGAASSLTVGQRTLVGHVVSVLNRTPHCASLSRVKLLELGYHAALVDAVEAGDYTPLSTADAQLARYAQLLTLDPGSVTEADVVALRAAGFDDHAIVDANAQVAHLNYTNRVANGLGLRDEVPADYPAFARVPE